MEAEPSCVPDPTMPGKRSAEEAVEDLAVAKKVKSHGLTQQQSDTSGFDMELAEAAAALEASKRFRPAVPALNAHRDTIGNFAVRAIFIGADILSQCFSRLRWISM